MKTLGVLGITILTLVSCSQTSLKKEEAATLIRSEKYYPRPYKYEINTADATTARKLLDLGLEESGMVTIDKTQKLKDAGQPIIHFTEKSKPFILGKDEKYKNVEIVKIADMDLGAVRSIQTKDDSKKATVEYTLVYKNLSPFSKLIKRDLSKAENKTITLSATDNGWQVSEQ